MENILFTKLRKKTKQNSFLSMVYVWQSYWIKGNNLDIFSETAQRNKLKWYFSHNWSNQNPCPKNLKLQIADLRPDVSEELNL